MCALWASKQDERLLNKTRRRFRGILNKGEWEMTTKFRLAEGLVPSHETVWKYAGGSSGRAAKKRKKEYEQC
jgi:hypothetical protein